MKKHYKKHLVKFCPLCGSNVVTHIGDNAFVCGTGDITKEAEEKVEYSSSRCNRVFAIVQPIRHQYDNTLHRKSIGAKVDQIRGSGGNMSNVLYSTDGKGRWWRVQWDEQCNEDILFGGRCQGTKGHKGVHWCYGLDGSYEWSDNDDDLQHGGGAGMTPPGHKDWVSPIDMADKHHLNFRNKMEVTDPEKIKKLDNEEELEEGASYTRPVSAMEIREMEGVEHD